MIELSQAAVRGIIAAAQGLQQKKKKATKNDVRDIIRQMHVLQIDTISVVARSPYLVLWSRLGDYDPRWLEDLLAEGALFEYWSHAACFLPIEDYPLYRPDMWMGGRARKWLADHVTVAETVLNHIRTNGAARSSDFERTDGQKGGWWNWKEEKIALEYLFYNGDLMIAKRHNFQRIYDLRERVLPDWDESQAASKEKIHEQFVLNTVKALGVTKVEWIADYFRMYKADALAALKKLDQQGLVSQVKVEGWQKPAYYHPDNQTLIDSAAAGKIPQSKTTLLSPFDPIVWDRNRARDLYNFDYTIECYTPAPKRIYGYFTLPILYKNMVIGRLDPKAHRKEGLFEIKALHLEPGVKVNDALVNELKTTLKDCATWHKTPNVIVRMANVDGLAERLSD
jgi:uncharacterized protein